MKKYFLLYLATFALVLLSKAQPVMNPINGPTDVCSSPATGYTFSTSASGSPSSYQWSVLGLSTGVFIMSPNSNITVINFPNTNLAYTLSCIASDTNGTSQPVFFIVKVYETPSVTFSGAQSFCQGSSTNLSASSTMIYSASSTLSYSWSPSTGISTNYGPTVTANPQITTNYSVLLSTQHCTNMALCTVSVLPLPIFSLSISKSLFCKSDPQTLSINGSGSTYSINSVLTPTQSTLVYTVSGGVLITVIGESPGACMSSASITFSVANCQVGLDEFKNKEGPDLNIYPNPNNGHFTISKAKDSFPIYIFDELGRTVRSYNNDEQKEIIVTGLSPGIYTISDGTNWYKLIIYD